MTTHVIIKLICIFAAHSVSCLQDILQVLHKSKRRNRWTPDLICCSCLKICHKCWQDDSIAVLQFNSQLTVALQNLNRCLSLNDGCWCFICQCHLNESTSTLTKSRCWTCIIIDITMSKELDYGGCRGLTSFCDLTMRTKGEPILSLWSPLRRQRRHLISSGLYSVAYTGSVICFKRGQVATY